MERREEQRPGPEHLQPGTAERAVRATKQILAQLAPDALNAGTFPAFSSFQPTDRDTILDDFQAVLHARPVIPEEFLGNDALKGGASEHEAYLVGSHVIRCTRDGFFDVFFQKTPTQYLRRILEYNACFPDTPMELLGISDDHGQPRIWTKQIFVEGEPAADFQDPKARLSEQGWHNLGGNRYTHLSGVGILDAHTENVLFEPDGTPRFIDVIIDSDTLTPETIAYLNV